MASLALIKRIKKDRRKKLLAWTYMGSIYLQGIEQTVSKRPGEKDTSKTIHIVKSITLDRVQKRSLRVKAW